MTGTPQTIGGIAALVEALTYLVGFVLLLTVFEPAGVAFKDPDPAVNVPFLIAHQAVFYLWNLIIYIVNGVFLVVLALALHEHMKAHAAFAAKVAAALGLIWAGLVIASGMILNVGIGAVAHLYAADPERAAALYLAISAVGEGLGGGNEIVGGLWAALISWCGLRVRLLPAALCILGLIAGVAGLLTVIPLTYEITSSVFGLGLLAWFAWLGVALLRIGAHANGVSGGRPD